MVVAIGREQIEDRPPVALQRPGRAPQPAAQPHEILVVDGSVGRLAVHHGTQGMYVSAPNRAVALAKAIEPLHRKMPTLAIVNQASPGQIDAGLSRHEPEGEFDRPLGLLVVTGEFQDTGRVT